MKIFTIESTNINGGNELADWVLNQVKYIEYKSIDDFDANAWLVEACHALQWNAVPSVGGLIAEFEEQLA